MQWNVNTGKNNEERVVHLADHEIFRTHCEFFPRPHFVTKAIIDEALWNIRHAMMGEGPLRPTDFNLMDLRTSNLSTYSPAL
jgi:hypothetical protein